MAGDWYLLYSDTSFLCLILQFNVHSLRHVYVLSKHLLDSSVKSATQDIVALYVHVAYLMNRPLTTFPPSDTFSLVCDYFQLPKIIYTQLSLLGLICNAILTLGPKPNILVARTHLTCTPDFVRV